jgi:hypothetical protein
VEVDDIPEWLAQWPGAAFLIFLGLVTGAIWGLARPGEEDEWVAAAQKGGWGAGIGLGVYLFGPLLLDTLA